MVHDCVFNPAVGCADRAGCSYCGWNPKEAQRRLKRRGYIKETAPDGTNIEDGRPNGQQSSAPSV